MAKVMQLKSITFREEKFEYRKNLIDYLTTAAGTNGMSFVEMRKSSQIIDHLEELEDDAEFVLEDDLYSFMMDRLENHLRIARVYKPLIMLVDDLKAAKSKSAQRLADEAKKKEEITETAAT